MDILIASSNRGKLNEIQAILSSQWAHLLIPADIGLSLDVKETGSTYAENAVLKAQAYCQSSQMICLADDSGLEVDALNGAPGLHSARYGQQDNGQKGSDAYRRRLLLENLTAYEVPANMPGWPAHFRCAVAIAAPHQPVMTAEGHCDGYILKEERGTNGFGYDPLFYFAEYGLTMAEISTELKNQISHRARALQAARPLLEKMMHTA